MKETLTDVLGKAISKLETSFGVKLTREDFEPRQKAGIKLLQATGVRGKDWDPLPVAVQEMIVNNSPQHRMERFAAGPEQVVEYDGRAMYMGCCDHVGLARGEAEWHVGASWESIKRGHKGLALVSFDVPDGWQHIGILPIKEHGGWAWPSHGKGWQGWVSLTELRLAEQNGWRIGVQECVSWDHGSPLTLWARRLSDLYLRACAWGDDKIAALYREICLHTIGSFHNRGFRSATMTVPNGDPRIIWDNIVAVGPEQTIIRTRAPYDKPKRQIHPEWSATVWSTARLRVCKALLSVPREHLVSVHGDAIRLTTHPGWPDDGKVGRFRIKKGNV
jgi:hypothetical protein